MRITGSHEILSSPAAVYDAMTDPERLRACVPGCESVTGTARSGLEAVVVQKVGPVRATYRGAVRFIEMARPDRVKVAGSGQGAGAGFASGEATCVLIEMPGGTRVDYEVEAHIGGRIERLGGRILESYAHRMTDGFFRRLAAEIEGRPVEPAPKGWLARLLSD